MVTCRTPLLPSPVPLLTPSFLPSIDYSAGRGKEKIDSIDVYEHRLIKLQSLVRDGPNKTNDADKEVDNVIRGPSFSRDLKSEFKTCNKCGERFVKHLLLQHTLYCTGDTSGGGPTTLGPRQDDEDEKEGEEKGEATEKKECFCQLCGKKFTSKTIEKHTKKCEERQKF